MVATRFYPGAQESLTTLPSRPFGLNERRHSKCKPLCLYSLPEPHDSVRRPFVGLKSRNLRDTDAYTEKNFSGQFFDSFFSKKVFFCKHERETSAFSRVRVENKTVRRKAFSKEVFPLLDDVCEGLADI